jgi:hypothetical protein
LRSCRLRSLAALWSRKKIELERRGLLKRGTGKLPKDFWTRPLPKLKGSLVKTLLKQREEARW